MTQMIPAFLIARFGATWAKVIVYGGIAATLLIAIGLFVWHERSIGAQGEVNKELQREQKVQTQIGDANSNAADARVNDATNLQNQQKEIEDAVRNATGPDDVRAQRGCVILRQQGRDTSGIPACRGS